MYSPIFLSGPSGIGKTYLEKHLIKNYNFKRFISTLTRPQRPGEQEGVDNYYISEEEYKKREAEGKFLTSIYIHEAWRGFEKGIIDNIITEGKIPISVVVPSIVIELKKKYPNAKAFYLLPSTDDLLVKRMRLREDPPEAVEKRLQSSKQEIEFYKTKAKEYYTKELVVTEDNFESIVQEILCSF
jgi:guanylate kinase